MKWSKHVKRDDFVIGLCLVDQLLLLASNNDVLPFSFHFVALTASLLVPVFAFSVVVAERYEKYWNVFRTGLMLIFFFGLMTSGLPMLIIRHSDE